jgi:ribosomal protein L13E
MEALGVLIPVAALVGVVVDYRRRLPDAQEEGDDRQAP